MQHEPDNPKAMLIPEVFVDYMIMRLERIEAYRNALIKELIESLNNQACCMDTEYSKDSTLESIGFKRAMHRALDIVQLTFNHTGESDD